MNKSSPHSDVNSYTIIPNAYVIHLVTTLELNNQTVFYDFHDLNGVDYLYTIFRGATTSYIDSKKELIKKAKQGDRRAIARLGLDAASLVAPGLGTGLAIAAAKQAV